MRTQTRVVERERVRPDTGKPRCWFRISRILGTGNILPSGWPPYEDEEEGTEKKLLAVSHALDQVERAVLMCI